MSVAPRCGDFICSERRQLRPFDAAEKASQQSAARARLQKHDRTLAKGSKLSKGRRGKNHALEHATPSNSLLPSFLFRLTFVLTFPFSGCTHGPKKPWLSSLNIITLVKSAGYSFCYTLRDDLLPDEGNRSSEAVSKVS